MAQFIRRRTAASGTDGAGIQVQGGAWEKSYPALVEFMTCQEWEPGSPRDTASFSFSIGDGGWKCRLSDKDGGLVAFMWARTPEELLRSVEKALRDDSLEWRKDQFAKPARGKK